MATPRMPSSSQIRSQMRAAQRKAEQQVTSDMRKMERDLERQLNAAQRKAETQAKADAARLQRELDRQSKTAQQKANAKFRQDVKQWERDANRRLNAARPTVTYTTTERQYLAPVEEQAQHQAETHPDRRDVFLCHAWDDRDGSARELHDLLESFGVDVWFSEKDVALGTSLIREIDRGLKMSRIGIVLVTPALLRSLASEGIADKELSALLATDRVIPVAHETTFEALREESPLLASRSGLSTAGSSLKDVAVKIADTVRPQT